MTGSPHPVWDIDLLTISYTMGFVAHMVGMTGDLLISVGDDMRMLEQRIRRHATFL